MMKTMLLAGASVLAFATSADALSLFNHTGGWQTFTAPTTGVYQIKAGGAAGGTSLYRNGGRGIILAGDFTLNAGDVLRIGVGGSGQDVFEGFPSDGEEGAGGGGGSFVVGLSNALLLAAGGGGGGGGHSEFDGDSLGRDAVAGPDGSAVPFGGSGGINGSGGSRGFPSLACRSFSGGGGGGWLGTGASCGQGGRGGAPGGGGGGTAASGFIFAGSGGFGGGGGGGGFGHGGGGGGGGFSGGGGGGGESTFFDDTGLNFSHIWTGGGGGGSYNASTVNAGSLGYTGRGHGFVSISDVIPTVGPGVPEPSTWAMLLTGFGFAGFLLRRRRLART